jgi:VWFA-related protein
VTLALDISQSVSGETLKRLQLGIEQLQTRVTAQDRLKLVTFNMRVKRLFDFGTPNADTKNAFSQVTALGSTAILDTVAVLLAAPADLERRQLVIVFSDGADTSSLTDRDVMLSVARRSRPAVTFVQPIKVVTQLTGAVASSANNPALGIQNQSLALATTRKIGTPLSPILSELAAETGGVVLQPTQDDDVGKLFAKIFDDFRSSYVLNFIPRGVSEHGDHTLAVRVTRNGQYAVRARKAYAAD